MDQSAPVHPVTNGLLPIEGKNNSDQSSAKEWVTFDSNSNHNQTNQASATSSSSAGRAHEHNAINQKQREEDHHPVPSSSTSLSEAAGHAIDILETVVAVIHPSASIQVSHDPLTDSSPASSPVFHKSFPDPSAATSAGDGQRGTSTNGSGIRNKQNQSNLMNEISSDKTIIPIPESITPAAASAITTTIGAASSLTRPNTLPSGSKSFRNGQVIVTLLPLNTSCEWVTAAKFRPELVPEELMHPSLTLTVEEYVQAMSILVNDHRFTMFNILYKRIIFIWISLGFLFLISMLFSGARGVSLFVGGSTWIVMNAIGIFACMWIKFKLLHALEHCVHSVNAILIKHKILLGVDDRGHLSCHKINLFFIYFDTSHCIKYLNDMVAGGGAGQTHLNGAAGSNASAGSSAHQRAVVDITGIDIDDDVVIITSASNARNSRKFDRSDGRADRLLLRYSQRWVKEFARKRLDLKHRLHYTSSGTAGDPNWTELPPRHCIGHRCPCQFIEEHLKYKPLTRFTLRDICC